MESSIRPPEKPKPSASGILAQNRLRNRLVLGWKSKQNNAALDSISERSMIVDGFGENQFDKEDNKEFYRNNIQLGSVWSEQPESTSVIKSSQFSGRASSTVDGRADLLSKRSLVIPGSESIAFTNNQSALSTITMHNKKLKHAKDSMLASQLKSHLNMSQVYQSEGGWDEVAETIAFKQAEFCYIAPDPSDHYRFSICETVPSGLRNNDYLTLSRNGILQSTVDGTAELIPYSDLMREHEIYNKLRRIPVFRHFRLWKPFLLWRRDVRRKKMTAAAKQLNAHLSLLDPFYQTQISVVLQRCIELRYLAVLRFRDVSVSDVDSYVAAQRAMHKQSGELRAGLFKGLLAHLCREGEVHAYNALAKAPAAVSVQHYHGGAATALQASGTKPAGSVGGGLLAHMTSMSAASTVGGVPVAPPSGLDAMSSTTMFSAGGATSKTKGRKTGGGSTTIVPPVHIVDNVSYTERASIRINCRKLAVFLRVVDFMVRDALYCAVEANLRALHTLLMGSGSDTGATAATVVTEGKLQRDVLSSNRATTALFKLTVVLKQEGGGNSAVDGAQDEDSAERTQAAADIFRSTTRKYSVVIDPAKSSVVSRLRVVLIETLRAGSLVEGAFFDPQCLEALVPIRDELLALPLEDIVMQDKDNGAFRLMHACLHVVSSDLDSCVGYVLRYRYLCLQYEKNAKMLAHSETTRLHDVSPEQMTAELQSFEESLASLADIADHQNIGVFRLEFLQFKETISRMVLDCKAQFHRLIPELYVANGDRFYAELSRFNDVLGLEPATLEQFVKVVDVYNRSTAAMERLQSSFQYIMSIRDILDAHAIPRTEATLRQHLTITRVWASFGRHREDFEERLEERNAVYLKELRARTKTTLLDPVDRAQEYLDGSRVNDPEADPEVVLGEVARIRARMEVVRKQGLQVEQCQEVLRFSVFSLSTVNDMLAALDSTHQLWSTVKLVRELQASFLAARFSDAPSDEVERQLRFANATLAQKVQAGTGSCVLAWVQGALQELQVIAPIVKKLQSKTQRDIHAQRIEEVLGRAIFDPALETTVGDLVGAAVDVRRHVAALDDIYEESLFQHNLEQQVAALETACAAQVFAFGTDRENKSLLFFSSLDELAVFFEDALISLNACIASRFSAPHHEAFQRFRDKLQCCIDMNAHIRTMQEGYLRIRVLFTSARTARYLSSSLRHFKLLDEVWRSVMKLARSDLKAVELYTLDKVCDDVSSALAAITATDKNTQLYVEEQCLRWPKLFLLDRQDLLDIFATQDPRRTFLKCRVLFPSLTDVQFDDQEPYNTVSVSSAEEVLQFRKPCSARSNLVDWLRSIDAAMSDRLADEIRDYALETRTLLDDLRVPKTCEQSRICFVQIRFWSALDDNLGKGSRQRGALRPQLQELGDELLMYQSMMANYTVRYQIKTMANLFVLLISHRDVLQQLLADPEGEDSSASFARVAAIKKYYHTASSTLTVRQGPFRTEYGMKYSGFCERLVVTPLTDKCFLALTAAMNDLALPVVRGPAGIGKRSTMAALTAELGLEAITFDCGQARDPTSFIHAVRAVMGTGLWLNVHGMERLSVSMTAVFLTVLSAVQTALSSNTPKMFLAGEVIDVYSVPGTCVRPRVCLMYSVGAHSEKMPFLPASVRQQFRPVYLQSPPRRVILTVLLSAFNFASVQRLAQRLDALCDYAGSHKLVPEDILLRLAVESVRLVGERNDRTPTAVPLQILDVAKLLFRRLPWHLQEHIAEVDLRFICNLFLETVYVGDGESSGDSAPTDVPNPSSFKLSAAPGDYVRILQSHLASGDCKPLVVVGPAAAGKTRLIRQAMDAAATEHNQSVDRIEQSKYNKKTSSGVPLARMEVYRRVLNPFVMADYAPETHRANGFDLDLGPAVGSALCLAAQKVLEDFIGRVDPHGPTQLTHVDTQSSLELSVLLSSAKYCATRRTRPVKFVYEGTELLHLDPGVACSVAIVCVREPLFRLEDVFHANIEAICATERKAIRQLFTSCVDEYLRPCAARALPADAYQSPETLVEGAFSLMRALFVGSGMLCDPGPHRWHEATMRRIAICSCIWTFGACSPSSRDGFDRWFREHFEVDAERTRESALYPVFQGRTIYDSFLHQPDETKAHLEWAVFGRKTIQSPAGGSRQVVVDTNSSEERLRRSFASLYYTTIFNGTEGGASLLIPTATAKAYSVIQASLMDVGGHVLVLGARGAGKSSLLRELLENSKRITGEPTSLRTAARWVCQTTDCGPKSLFGHMNRCRSALYPMLMERRMADRGSLFVEDVNIRLHANNHDTCAEFIRTLCESSEIYNTQRAIWQSADKMYTLLAGKNSEGNINERFVRHQNILCCDADELRGVFATRLLGACPVLKEDLAEDLTKLTFELLEGMRRAMRALVGGSKTVGGGGGLSKLNQPDLTFIASCCDRSVAVSADHILSMLVRAVPCLSAYTPNDAVRVWGRVAADYSARHPALSELVADALAAATSEQSYLFPAFTSIVDRETMLRAAALEAVTHAGEFMPGMATQNRAAVEYPLSYTRGASGFHKTGPGVFAGITTAEYVRETFLKKHGNGAVCRELDCDSLALWTDVLTLSAQFTCPCIAGSNPVILLTNTTPYVSARVVEVAALYSQMSARTTTLASGTDKRSEISDMLLEAFLLDDTVLQGIRKYLSADGVETIVNSAHPDPLITKLLERVKARYSCAGFGDSTDQSSALDLPAGGVWHWCTTRCFADEAENWRALLDAVEARSDAFVSCLASLGPALDPRMRGEMRVLVQEFLARQHHVVTCQDAHCTDRALRIVSDIPCISASIFTVALYDSYADNSGYNELCRRAGPVVAERLSQLLDAHANRASDTLLSAQHNQLADTVRSSRYRNATMEFIIALYDRMAESQWERRFQQCAKALFNAHKEASAEWVDEPTMSEQHAQSQARGSNESFTLYPLVLGNATYCAVYSRYLAVTVDGGSGGGESADNTMDSFSNLTGELQAMGLSASFASLKLSNLLPIATALTLNGTYEESHSFELEDGLQFQKMRAVLQLVAGLPECSRAKRYLCSLALLLLVSNEAVELEDYSTCGYFALRELLGLEVFDAEEGNLNRPQSSFNAVRVELTMVDFSSDTTHTPVDTPQLAVRDSRERLRLDETRPVRCTLVILPHSVVPAELLVIGLLRRNLLSSCFPMLAKVWRTMQTVAGSLTNPGSAGTHGAFLLSFEVERFNAQFTECVAKVVRPVSTLVALMSSLRLNQNADARLLIGLWDSFDSSMVLFLGAQEISVGGEVSSAVFAVLNQLRDILSPKDWGGALMEVLLHLYIDSSSPQGAAACHKVLTQLLLGANEEVGIVAVERKSSAEGSKDDDGGKKKRGSGGNDAEEEENEEEEEEEEEDECRLADNSRLVLKQTLLTVSQSLAAGFAARSVVVANCLIAPSAATNSIVVSSIERNLADWADWAADLSCGFAEMPNTGSYRMNWLDRLCVTLVIKPSAVPALLLSAIADVGLSLPFQSDIKDYTPLNALDLASAGRLALCSGETGAADVSSTLPRDIAKLRVFLDAGQCARDATQLVHAPQLVATAITSTRKSVLVTPTAEASAAIASAAIASGPVTAAVAAVDANAPTGTTADCSTQNTSTVLHAVLLSGGKGNDLNLSTVLPQQSDEPATAFALAVFEFSQPTTCRADTLSVEAVSIHHRSTGRSESAVAVSTRLDSVRSTAYFLPRPAVPGTLFSEYKQLLGYLYHNASAAPLCCADEHRDIVYRIRWVLLLFHASLLHKLRDCSSVFVGIDSLLYAYRLVDQLYPGDPVVVASVPLSAPPPGARASFLGMQFGATSRPATGLPRVREPVDTDLTFTLLVHYIADCHYCNLVQWSAGLVGVVRATFLSFFTPASCDPGCDYYIQGKVALPADFSRPTAVQFFRSVHQLVLDGECSWVDLVCGSTAEENSRCAYQLLRGAEESLPRIGEASEEGGATQHTVPRRFLTRQSRNDRLSVITSSDSLDRIRTSLEHLLSLIPDRIRTDSKDITEHMTAHKLFSTAADKSFKEHTSKRRPVKRAAQRNQTREFQPLWAYALSECFDFNRAVESLRNQLTDLVACKTSLARFLLDRGVVLSRSGTEAETAANVLRDLERGFVPLNWMGNSYHSSNDGLPGTKLEEWMGLLADRRHMLHSWLTQGHPGILRLHLLRNPSGLLHALRETFSLKAEVLAERVHLHYSLREANAVSLADVAVLNATNHSCNILITGVHLHNATYSHRNAILEFLSDFSASSYGQRLVLQVSASEAPYEVDEEEFLCPLYVSPSHSPAAVDLLAMQSSTSNTNSDNQAVAYVPIATTEDTEDCRMLGIALHCCPKWRLPA